jgi:hypothetical protein
MSLMVLGAIEGVGEDDGNCESPELLGACFMKKKSRTISLKMVVENLLPEQRARVKKRAAELISEEMTL